MAMTSDWKTDAALSPEDLRMSRGVRAMQKALKAALIEAQRATGLEGEDRIWATVMALCGLVGDQGATDAFIPIEVTRALTLLLTLKGFGPELAAAEVDELASLH